MIRELSACRHQDRSRRKQARRACRPRALKVRADEQFTKAGSEDWQSTLTRAPLFANLFFDRLAALGSRAVNTPFRALCFVALFDQVVDCRLLAYVPPVDTPWRCGGHSHSPRPVAAFSAFYVGRVSLTESQNSRSCIYRDVNRKMWYLGLSSSGSGDRNGRRIECGE